MSLPIEISHAVHVRIAFFRSRVNVGVPNRSEVISAYVASTLNVQIDLNTVVNKVLLTTPEPIELISPSESQCLQQYCQDNGVAYNYILCSEHLHCPMCSGPLYVSSLSNCYVYDDKHPASFGLPSTQISKKCDKCEVIYHHGCMEHIEGKHCFTLIRPKYSDQCRFWRHNKCTVIATSSLNRVVTEQYHSHSGISTISDEWNNLHNDSAKPKRGFIIEKHS